MKLVNNKHATGNKTSRDLTTLTLTPVDLLTNTGLRLIFLLRSTWYVNSSLILNVCQQLCGAISRTNELIYE